GVLGGLAGLVLTRGAVFGPAFAVAAGAAGGAVLGALIGLTAAGRHRAERTTVAEAVRAEPVTLLGFGLCGALTGLPPLRLAHAGPLPLAAGVAGAFVLAFALGVVFRIATGGWSEDAELAHPREALQRNPAIGVAFGLTGGVAAFLVFVLNQGVAASLACALTGGVAFGLSFGAVAWTRTMIGLAVAAARGLLPLRLWTFLDWACEARLLRVSGATYQFRHRELQDFLTPREDGAAPGPDGTTGHRETVVRPRDGSSGPLPPPVPGAVVMMCGLAGSGKTTYARRLEAGGYRRLSADEIIWRRVGHDAALLAPAEYEHHQATADQEIQRELLRLLAAGEPVVLDEGFWSRAARDRYKTLIEEHGGTWTLIYLKADPETLRRRLAVRDSCDGPGNVTVSPELLDRHLESFEEPRDEGEHTVPQS
ncbi:AAA family ATPase, partial [Actinomadura roseirufa]|uniref:AAA family ATPase n=1 Tax=Actinomadura roseirufa TaxID=2094049 RepID=UPI001A95586F